MRRHSAVLVAALVILLSPSACFAGEADATDTVNGKDAEAPAPAAAPGTAESASDKEAQARFDQLMKSAENAEDMSSLEREAPPPPGLSGSVQTNDVVDPNEPLVKMPGVNVPINVVPKTASVKPSIEGVKTSYRNGRWKDALDMIAQLKPTDKTHYYAGLCYQAQGQLRAAAGEFQWVAAYSKDPTIRYNSAQAIIAIASYAKVRTAYKGQGNNFARGPVGSMRRGGGGGAVVRRG